MTLETPCEELALTINEDDPFPDLTTHLIIDSPDQSITWSINSLTSMDTAVSCGTKTVEFYNADTDGAIDTGLFDDKRTGLFNP